MKMILKLLLLIVLAFAFFGVIAPISMILRLMRLDVLNLKLSYSKESYWIERSNVQHTKNFWSQIILK